MKTNKLTPIHPGEILREEFMKAHGLSQNALARALGVPPQRINESQFGHSPSTMSRGASFAGSITTCFTRWRFHVQVMWTRPSLVWMTAG